MKISVIVPVYNVEKYLDQCIQSIIHQTYINLEIILVDDGSTDQSGSICDKYAGMDQRIKVIHKENGGLSSTRNKGFQFATGDYVLFIDSDDFYEKKDGIEILVQSISNNPVDILNFHLKKYNEDNEAYKQVFNEIFVDELYKIKNYEEKLMWLIKNSQYISSACNKLIKRQFLIENQLFFEEGILSEDIEWSLKLMITAKSIGISNLDFYVYRQRNNSITHSVSDKHIQDLYKIIEESNELIINLDNKKMKEPCYRYLSFQYGTLLINIHYASKETRHIYFNKIKSYSYLLKYYSNNKMKLLYFIKRFLGFKVLYFATFIFSKVR